MENIWIDIMKEALIQSDFIKDYWKKLEYVENTYDI